MLDFLTDFTIASAGVWRDKNKPSILHQKILCRRKQVVSDEEKRNKLKLASEYCWKFYVSKV